jgi:hypothetical protein
MIKGYLKGECSEQTWDYHIAGPNLEYLKLKVCPWINSKPIEYYQDFYTDFSFGYNGEFETYKPALREFQPRPWQIDFLPPATDVMEGIIDLHHDIFFFLVVISFFVT